MDEKRFEQLLEQVLQRQLEPLVSHMASFENGMTNFENELLELKVTTSSIENRMARLETEVSSNKAEVSGLKSAVVSLDVRVSSIQAELVDIKATQAIHTGLLTTAV